jgi:methylglutaconyl-CoA hydratase
LNGELVETEDHGPARVLRLNRPEVRNALNGALVDALLAALDAAESSATVRGLVLTGAGKDFCAGADLKVLQEIARRTREENRQDSAHLAGLFRRIHTSSKPVIAAVHGNALAGGSGLACVCDRVIAAEDSHFGFTESRIGFVAAIVSRFLVDRVGAGRARELLLSGRRLGSGEALAFGLADRIVPPDQVLARAVEEVRGLARCAASSLALTKRLLAELPGKNLDEALEFAAALNADTRATEDCREGVAAFLEKRKPRWIAELDDS